MDDKQIGKLQSMINLGDDSYYKLRDAIIKLAVSDYRQAWKLVKRYSYNQNEKMNVARSTIREIERFFRSDWFSGLTDIDPEALIRKLREERE